MGTKGRTAGGVLGFLFLGLIGGMGWGGRTAATFSEGASSPEANQSPRPHAVIEPSRDEVPIFLPSGEQIRPYLIDRQPTRIQIAWRTRVEVSSEIQLLEGGAVAAHQKTPEAYQHSASFEGLVPGTVYEYRVPGLPPGFVSTPRDDERRSFAIIGHTHGTEQVGHYPDTLLAACIADFSPDYVIHAGDCVYHSSPKDWHSDFFRPFQDVASVAPIHVSPGNHDSGWPFMFGYDLRLFRELFPNPYPEAVGDGPAEAFYSVQHGNVQFFFLSYVADMTLEGTQVPWLLESLEQSEATFKVVVFGGMNTYYDKGSFLELMEGTSVDAIVNGDGSASSKGALADDSSVPRFVLGASSGTPTPWLACESTAHSLVLKEMLGDGTTTRKVHVLQDRGGRRVARTLGEMTQTIEGRKLRLQHRLTEPLSSTEISGLQFELEEPHGTPVTGFAYFDIRPQSKRSEGGFRSQYFRLDPPQTKLTVELSPGNPLGQGPYEVLGVRLYLNANPGLQPGAVKSAVLLER